MKNWVQMWVLVGILQSVEGLGQDLKITLSQRSSVAGDVAANVKKVREDYQRAVREGADLIIFPELFLSGYGLRDHFLRGEALIPQVEKALDSLMQMTEGHETALVIGHPSWNEGDGQALLNHASVFYHGERIHRATKRLLPNYDYFEEGRFFQSSPEKPTVFEFKGERVAVMICEDWWGDLRKKNGKKHYLVNPIDEIESQNPSLGISLSSSPGAIGKNEKRLDLHSRVAERLGIPLIWVNETTTYDDVTTDGRSFVLNAEGELVTQLRPFEEDDATVALNQETRQLRRLSNDSGSGEEIDPYELLFKQLVTNLRAYAEKTGLHQVVIGLSGGIDSSVSAAIAVTALGAENVHGRALPGIYSSPESESYARELAKGLGLPEENFKTISIREEAESMLKKQKHWNGTMAVQGIQSRLRSDVLLGETNALPDGGFVISNGNRLENLAGYFTIGGDNEGGTNPIGNLYKREVYGLAHFINRTMGGPIPESIVDRAPTAELLEDQKDTDDLPESDLADEILRDYIDNGLTREEVARKYTFMDPVRAKKDIRWVYFFLKKIWDNEHKRRQGNVVPSVRVPSVDMNGWRHLISTRFEKNIPSEEFVRGLFLQNQETVYLSDVEGRWDRVESFLNQSNVFEWNEREQGGFDVKIKEGTRFVFGGDAIDKGPNGLRILRFLVDAKKQNPDQVVLLMGNRDLNKLRFLDELSDDPEEMKTFLSEKLGAPDAFEFRREELETDRGKTISDGEVFESIMSDLHTEGVLAEYLSLAQLGFVDESSDSLFIHGAVTDQNLGLLPEEDFRRISNVRLWVELLNRWAADEVQKRLTPQARTSRRSSAIIDYQSRTPGLVSNPFSVVCARFSDCDGNPALPSEEVMKVLTSQGIYRVVAGHTPVGEAPVVKRIPLKKHSRHFELILGDGSMASGSSSPMIRMNSNKIFVRAETPYGQLGVHLGKAERSRIGQTNDQGDHFLGVVDSSKGLFLKKKNGYDSHYYLSDCEKILAL